MLLVRSRASGQKPSSCPKCFITASLRCSLNTSHRTQESTAPNKRFVAIRNVSSGDLWRVLKNYDCNTHRRHRSYGFISGSTALGRPGDHEGDFHLISNPKLATVLISDLAELSSIESKIRGDLYFCCLGTTIKAAGSKENFEKVDHAAISASNARNPTSAEICARHQTTSAGDITMRS